MEKTIDIGGTSDAGDIPIFVEFAKILNPKNILDIGCGCFGKTGYLLRQYVEHKFRHLYGVNYLKIDAVEAYNKNAAFVKSLNLYDNVFNLEAISFLKEKIVSLEKYDIVVCSHILEHHTEEDAWLLLELMYEVCSKGIILACPYGLYKFEGNLNPYQDHRSTWTPDKISIKYPITTPVITRNNTGHEEFIIVIPK